MSKLKLSEESIKKCLSYVINPEYGNDLISLNMIKDIKIKDFNIKIIIDLKTTACALKSKIEKNCKQIILQHIDKIETIHINFNSKAIPICNLMHIKGVKHIIPISSGKGGVGKSTVAINIAKAFLEEGFRAGVLDADLYGPNIPALLNNYNQPNITAQNKLLPVDHEGLKFMSMGLLLEKNQPVIWRGPMLHSAIKQFLNDVLWENLDYLFVDLPPGTGDVQLSLCQMVNLTGALVVTTPQQLSVADVRKGIEMFRQLQVDILGIVENMSYFIHSNSKEIIYVFGKDGGKILSKELNLPLLAQIPIDPNICTNINYGIKYLKPVVKKLRTIVQSKLAII